MMNNSNIRKRRNKGFTLMETMVVVAIIIVLVAVSVGLIPKLVAKLHQNRLDSYAETLFTGAQTRLTELRITGRENMYSTPSGTFSDEYWPVNLGARPADPDDESEFITGQMGYVLANSASAKAAAATLFPQSITESEIWNGYWVIEYNYNSGTVYGVFFSEEPFTYDVNSFNTVDGSTGYSLRGTPTDNGFEARLNGTAGVKGSTLGYYGKGSARLGENKYYPQVVIENGEVLYAKIYIYDKDGQMVNPVSEGINVAFSLSQEGANDSVSKTLTSACYSSGGYYVALLDELPNGTKKIDGAAVEPKQFKDLVAGTDLVPGIDTVISVSLDGEMTDDGDYYASSAGAKGQRLFNSLFDDSTVAENITASSCVARISCGRHLQNLSTASGTTAAFTSAKIIRDISFEKVNAKAGEPKTWYDIYSTKQKFAAITNTTITSLDGKNESTGENCVIDYLTISQSASTNLALFRELRATNVKNLTFKNATVTNTYIKSGKTPGAAVLAGKISTNSVTVENVSFTDCKVSSAGYNAGVVCCENTSKITVNKSVFENISVESTSTLGAGKGEAGVISGYASSSGNIALGGSKTKGADFTNIEVSSGNENAGIVCGRSTKPFTIYNTSIKNFEIEAGKAAGGICGEQTYNGSTKSVISNVTAEAGNTKYSINGKTAAGAFLGSSTSNVTVTGENKVTGLTVSAENADGIAGGLVGKHYVKGEQYLTLTIEWDKANKKDTIVKNVRISAGGNAGGLVGEVASKLVINGAEVVNEIPEGTLTEDAAKIIGSNDCAGGIIGYYNCDKTGYTASISNVQVLGYRIKGDNNAAGVVGKATNVLTITSAQVAENVVKINGTDTEIKPVITSSKCAAGLVGSTAAQLTVKDSEVADCTIAESDTYAGGMVGSSTTSLEITDSSVTDCKIEGTECAGGIVASAGGTLTLTGDKVYLINPESTATEVGNVDRYISGKNSGGLVGTAAGDSVVINTSFAATTLGNDATKNAGGLIGYVDVDSGNVTITSSYADCYVFGEYASGLVGNAASSVTMTGCYSAGFLTGSEKMAGLACSANDNGGSFTADFCYAATHPSVASKYYATVSGANNTKAYYYEASSASFPGANNGSTMLGIKLIDKLNAGGTKFIPYESASDPAYTNPYNLAGQNLTYKDYEFPRIRVNDNDSDDNDNDDNDNNPKMLRHYGDWYMDEYKVLVEIINGEVLYARVTVYNKAGTVYSGIDPANITYTLSQGSASTDKFDLSGVSADSAGRFMIVLDKLHDGSAGSTANSARQFKEIVGSTLTPGLSASIDVKVKHAVVTYKDGSKTDFNSLFDESSSSSNAVISCGRHLQNLSTAVSNVSTKITSAQLKESISFATGSAWANTYGSRAFKPIQNTNLKSFDGKNKTITSLKVTTSSSGGTNHAGLFNNAYGTVQNLTLDSPVIAASKYAAGALAGQLSNNAKVSGVTVNNATVTAVTEAGGLAGNVLSGSTVSGVTVNKATVTGKNNSGGLIGLAESSTISNAVVKDAVATGGIASGGLVGKTKGTFVVQTSKVFLTSIDQKDNLDDVTRKISGGTDCGGLIGRVEAGTTTVKNSFAATVVGNSSTTYAGGLIGYVGSATDAATATVTSCYGAGYSFGQYASGLIGYVGSRGTVNVTGCSAAGYLKGTTGMAGLVYGTISSGGYCFTVANPYENEAFYATAVSASDSIKETLYYGNKSFYSANNLGYCMLGEKAADLSANLNGYFEVKSTYTPYNMLKQGLSAYPYPLVKGLEQYGDWAAVAPLGLVYYEIYSDGTYGVYTMYQNGRKTAGEYSSLKNNLDIIGDGYGIYFPNYKNSGAFSSTVTVGAYNNGSWDMNDPSFSHQYTRICQLNPTGDCIRTSYKLLSGVVTANTDFQRIVVGKDFKVKESGTDADMIVSLDMVTTDRYYGNDYIVYKKIKVEYTDNSGNTGVLEPSIYASTLFAKDFSVYDPYSGTSSESAAMSKKTVYIRTARQLGLLGHNYSDFTCYDINNVTITDSGKGIDNVGNMTFVLDHDIDWTSYAWAYFSYDPPNPRVTPNFSFSSYKNGEYFKQPGKEDSAIPNLWPIGADEDIGFIGTFDGQNYTVSNMSVSSHAGLTNILTQKKYIGLFAFIKSSGTVKNLKLINFSGTESEYGDANVYTYAGTLAGKNLGTIENVVVARKYGEEKTFYPASLYHGTFVGRNDGKITRCSISGYNISNDKLGEIVSRKTTTYIGGFVGYNAGNISYCESNNPHIYRSGGLTIVNYVGGFSGVNTGTISYCCAISTLETVGFNSDDCFAGFCANGSGTFNNCYCISSCLSKQTTLLNRKYSPFAPSGNGSGNYYVSAGGLYYYGQQREVWGQFAKYRDAGTIGTSVSLSGLSPSGFTKTKTIIFGKYKRENIPTVMRENGNGDYVFYGDYPATANGNVGSGSVKGEITSVITTNSVSSMPRQSVSMLYAGVQDLEGKNTTDEYVLTATAGNDNLKVEAAAPETYDEKLGMTVAEATDPEKGAYPNAVAFALTSSDEEGPAEITITAEKKEDTEAIEEPAEEEKSGFLSFLTDLFAPKADDAEEKPADTAEQQSDASEKPAEGEQSADGEKSEASEEETEYSDIPEPVVITVMVGDEPEEERSDLHVGLAEYDENAKSVTTSNDVVVTGESETGAYPEKEEDYAEFTLPIEGEFDSANTDLLLYMGSVGEDDRFEITEVKVVKYVEADELEEEEQKEKAENADYDSSDKTAKTEAAVKTAENTTEKTAEKKESGLGILSKLLNSSDKSTESAEGKTDGETEENKPELVELVYLIYSKEQEILWKYTDYYCIITEPVTMQTEAGVFMFRPVSYYTASGEVDPDAILYITLKHGDETYTLRYQPTYHTVHLNANDGTGTVKDVSVSRIQTAKLPANSFTRAGFRFFGWSDTPNGELYYSDGQVIGKLKKDLELYAIWIPADEEVPEEYDDPQQHNTYPTYVEPDASDASVTRSSQ